PFGSLYSAADFNPIYKGGTWLVSSSEATPRLSLIPAAGSGTPRMLATGTGYSYLAWSPRGDAAALVSKTGHLAVWTQSGGVRPVAVDRGEVLRVSWAPDGRGLAIASLGAVLVSADGGMHFRQVEQAWAEQGTLSWSFVR